MTPSQVLFYLDWAIRLALAGRVAMSRRPVPVILAWVAVLLAPVPYVAIFAYAIVGEVRLGRWRIRRYARLMDEFGARMALFWRGQPVEWAPECDPYKQISHVATLVGDIPPVRGNSLTVLGNAEGVIASMIQDIDRAKRRVHMLFYIWAEDGAGEQVVSALVRAAGRGVECRVLVDGVGSRKFLKTDLPSRLTAAGVKFAVALPVNPLRMLLSRIDVRNHRKIAVMDGCVAYAGSQNVNDSRYGWRPIRRIGPYIDAMVRLEGPAAQALDAVFLLDWQIESGEDLGPRMGEMLPVCEIPKGGSTIHVVPSGPGQGVAAMRDAMVTVIYAARRELIITTPYFVPDEATKEALIAAALRGVQVTLVIPRKTDSPTTKWAARAHYLDLLDAGVRIMHHQRALLHSKTITVDSNVGVIGSTNIDMRSFYLNYEVTLFIYDPDETSLLRMLQVSYMEESLEIIKENWVRRPLRNKLLEAGARLLGPLL
jgi:cardiolipin synthase